MYLQVFRLYLSSFHQVYRQYWNTGFSNKYTHRLTHYWLKGDSLEFIVFMPPTLEKLKGHIAIGLSVLVCVRPPKGVLWYFHTYVGSGHFLGLKILNFNIFWGFQKNEYFFCMKILWIFFGGHHEIGLYFRVISMHIGSFLKVKVQNGDIFGVAKISNIFWGAWNFWYFLGCLHMQKKWEYSPGSSVRASVTKFIKIQFWNFIYGFLIKK